MIALAEASTSPATTARIVANAAALNSASAMSPPVEPSPPNSACEVSGAARLPPLPTASSAPAPRMARAPKPMIVTSTVKTAIRLIVHTTDVRAALAFGTVKKRISTCGRPAVPMKIVRPVEITSSGVLRKTPLPRIALPSSCSAAALSRISDGLKLNFASTAIATTVPAVISMIALMIWTQVVASMPPNAT